MSGDIPSGFLIRSFFVEANVLDIPQDPPLVLHLPKSWQLVAQLVTSPLASAEVGLGPDSNGQSPGQKTNALMSQRAGFFSFGNN